MYIIVNTPLDARFSLALAATNVGFKSDIGLALQMFPPSVYKNKRVILYSRKQLRKLIDTYSHIPYLLTSKPP